MTDVNLAVTAPLNADAPLFTPAPTINYRKQKGNLFDVGADVNINPANNQQSLPGTTAVVATTVAGTLATDFANTDVVDGVTLATNDVILIKDQADPAENGVYVVAASGAPARKTGWNTGVGLQAFQQTVEVLGGTSAGKFFVQTNNVLSPFIQIGTTPLVFAEDSNQMVNQRNILAATAPALDRQNVKPLFAPPYAREFGGVITWDNSTLENFYSKEPVKAASTANIADLANASVIQDGVTLVEGDRVLVMAQTTKSQNGIYVVGAVTSGIAAFTRAIDASENSNGADFDNQVRFGMCVFVSGGTVNGKATFFQSTANPITVGTTALVFLNLTTVMTVNQVNQPVDGNKNIDSQSYSQA